MSVAGFIAVRGGSVGGINLGRANWQPGITSQIPSLQAVSGQSRSYRGSHQDSNLGNLSDITVWQKPLVGLSANKKLMTIFEVLGHQAGTTDSAIKGLGIFYWAVDSAGSLQLEGPGDLTLITNTLQGSNSPGISQVISGNACNVRMLNGDAGGLLDWTLWATTFERIVGTISGGG